MHSMQSIVSNEGNIVVLRIGMHICGYKVYKGNKLMPTACYKCPKLGLSCNAVHFNKLQAHAFYSLMNFEHLRIKDKIITHFYLSLPSLLFLSNYLVATLTAEKQLYFPTKRRRFILLIYYLTLEDENPIIKLFQQKRLVPMLLTNLKPENLVNHESRLEKRHFVRPVQFSNAVSLFPNRCRENMENVLQ
ncbi:hypothetical protein Tsp_05054 [Trichinella spiralis]|uniref:hypothetical protein n=1 Tax=Trichinella spiralis TaxID=6334 RepID=UPI0001EFECEC|nr:hypothetical protein Tsp_05054 [Trichinella spiralis]